MPDPAVAIVPALCSLHILPFLHFAAHAHYIAARALCGYVLFCKVLIISSYFLLSVASVLVFGTVATLHNKCHLIIK